MLTEAENKAKAALALDPDLPIGHYAMGMVLRGKRDYANALIEFGNAVNFDRAWNHPRFHAQYANELINNGKYVDALPLITEAITQAPKNLPIATFHWIRGRAKFFAGDYSGAIADLEHSAFDLRRDNLWYIWLYLVSACVHDGDLVKANQYLVEFDRRFPTFVAGTIDAYELSNPNPNIADGLQKFHDGLGQVGRYP